jgi:hypothetical protein
MADRKPQLDQEPRDDFDRELHPHHLEGQNIGPVAEEAHRPRRTAFDVKPMHRCLRDWPDDELKEIPVLEEGTPLQQGATYLNLRDSPRDEITARGGMRAGAGDCFIPKDEVPYPTWNRLRGITDPARTAADPFHKG